MGPVKLTNSHLQTGGAACGGYRTHTLGKRGSGRSHSSTVRNQDPMPRLYGDGLVQIKHKSSLPHNPVSKIPLPPNWPSSYTTCLGLHTGGRRCWRSERVVSNRSSRWPCLVSLRATQKTSKAWGPLLGSKLRSSTFWLKLPTLAYDTRIKYEITFTYLTIILFLQMSFLKMPSSISRIYFIGKTCMSEALPIILKSRKG